VTDAIAAANAIASALTRSGLSKLPAEIAGIAQKQIEPTITAIKKQLATLYAQKIISEEQITEILRLREALEKLNRINLTPFEKALQLLKDNVQQVGAETTQAWSQFWSDLVSGTEGAGKKFLAALINIIAQQLEIQALDQTAKAIVSFADGDYAGAAKHAAAAVGLGALGGILQGFASSLASSKSSSASTGSAGVSSGSSGQSSTPTQIINVGAVGRSQSPLPAQEHKITLDIRPNEAFIVKTVQTNVKGNGSLRTLIKQNG
jgi:hypothetical protein